MTFDNEPTPITYLEVPPDVTGPDQAKDFDSRAAQHHEVFCRRVIKNEFSTGHPAWGRSREARLLRRTLVARAKAIRASGLTPVVLVERLPGGLRKRELVGGRPEIESAGISA